MHLHAPTHRPPIPRMHTGPHAPTHLTMRGGTRRTMSPLPAVITITPRSRAAVTSGPAICKVQAAGEQPERGRHVGS